MHDLEARVVPGEKVRNGDTQQLAEDGAQFRQTGESAVVAAVGAASVTEITVAGQRQQLCGKVELFRGRLTASQIECELLRLELRVLRALALMLGGEFFMAHQPDLGLDRHPERPFTDEAGSGM